METEADDGFVDVGRPWFLKWEYESQRKTAPMSDRYYTNFLFAMRHYDNEIVTADRMVAGRCGSSPSQELCLLAVAEKRRIDQIEKANENQG